MLPSCKHVLGGVLAAALLLVAVAPADQARYFYDALGRLSAVLNDQGEIALYSYDAVGNLLEISRRQAPTAAPTITAVAPNIIQAGATEVVTITGTNLLLASVSTSHPDLQISAPQELSDTLLTVTLAAPIPTTLGATDVTVTNGVGSASATLSLATAPPPVITSIDPDRGGPGSTVLLEGRHFASIAGQTQVAFEGPGSTRVPATILNESPAADGMRLRVEAPAGIVSGPVTVTVGAQTSAGVLFTVPTLSSITAVADFGIPADPTHPSTNIDQTILLHGGWFANGGAVLVPILDDAGVAGTETAFLTSVSSDGTRGVLSPPAAAATGTMTIQGNGSAFLQIVPKLTSFAVQTGETWPPQTPIALTGFGFQEGRTTILFSGTSTPVNVSNVLPGNGSLNVVVPPGATEGPITVTTPGGTSNSVLVPRLDQIAAAASVGIPANPAKPSANIGQTIGLRGVFFSSSTTTNLGPVGVVANNGTEASLMFTRRPSGGAITVNGPGIATVQIVPTVSSFMLPPGSRFQAGMEATILGSGFKTGQTTVTFSGSPTSVPANGVSSTEDQLTVTIPSGAVLGPFTVSTDEGTSNSLDIPVLQSVLGVAAQGVPADPALPSGNTSQKVEFRGTGFSSATQVLFPTASSPVGASAGPDPADISPDGRSMLIAVPFHAVSGPITLANGIGSADFQVVPTVFSLVFPPGIAFQPGVLVSVLGAGFHSTTTSVQFAGAADPTPATGPVTESQVSVTIPADAVLGPLTVTTDGGTSNSLEIPALHNLVATALLGTPADPILASANTRQTIQVEGAGLTNRTLVMFPTMDDRGTIGTQSVTVSVGTGGTMGSAAVPLLARSGTVTLNGQGAVPLQIVPTLSSLALPSGESFSEGTVLTLFGSGFVPGMTTVQFSGIPTPVPAETVSPTSGSLTVPIPAGATAGPITVMTDGGTSNSLTPPVLLDIVSTAVIGTPADPAVPSVNAVGTGSSPTVQVVGSGLTDRTQVFFPVLGDTGVLGTEPSLLFNVSPDGSQALVVVPATATTGPVTIDGIGSVRLQIVPTLSSVHGPIFRELAQATLKGSGFQPRGTRVSLPGLATPVSALSVTNENRQLTVSTLPGVTSGEVFVTTSGGTSNVLTPATLHTLTATAQTGIPLDPAVASANVGQIIDLQGQRLTTFTEVMFPSTDDAGVSGTVTAQLSSVGPTGTTGQVFVPATATSGPVTVSGHTSVLLQIVPTLTSFSLPPGQPLAPGEVLAMQGTGFKERVTLVQFTGVQALSDAEVSNGNQSLTVPIPQGVADGPVTVQTDGGTSNSLVVAEPTLQSISTVAGQGTPVDSASASTNTSEFQGSSRFITLLGTGLTEGTQILFPVISDAGVATTEVVAPSVVNPNGTDATARVPINAATGSITVNGQGAVLLQIVPTLTSFVSGNFQPGEVLTLAGTGFQEGHTSVLFAGVSTPVPAADVFSDCGGFTGQCGFTVNNRLTVTVPAGAMDGVVQVTTSGGTSNGLTLSGTQLTALLGVAAKGTPADPGQPSANVGQRIQAQGVGLTSSTRLRYPTFSGAGVPGTFTVPVFGIRNGGTLGDVTFGFIPTTGNVTVDNGIGSVFLQIVPEIFEIAFPPGQPFVAGTTLTIFGKGFKEGDTVVNFTGAGGPTPALDVDDVDDKLTVTVPTGATVGPVTVTTNGGTSNAIVLPDLQVVMATAQKGLPADPAQPSANASQTIEIHGSGLSVDTKVFFTTTDDNGVSGFTEVTLRSSAQTISSDGTQAILTLPFALVTSGPMFVNGTGSAFLQIVPTVFAAALPSGQPFAPGVVLTLQGNGFKEGTTTVTFQGASAPVPANDVFSAGQALTVTIPAGAVEGPVTVTTDGGTSNQAPTLLAVQATALQGTPADPALPSANSGQAIKIQGVGFNSATNMTFPTTSDAGVPGTITFPNPSAVVSNISPDGTIADVRVVQENNITTGVFRINGLGGALVQIVPTAGGFRIPAGGIFDPGEVLTIFGSGFKEGATTLTFPGVTHPVPADDVFDRGETLIVTIPSGAAAGDLTIITDGGTSNVLTVGPPHVDALFAQPVAGIPNDPGQAAATVGQLINLHGGGFVSGMDVLFTSTDDQGVPGTVTQTPFFFEQDGSRVALHVPPLATTGPVTISTGTGSVTLQIIPTNHSLVLPPGETLLTPGQTIDMVGTGLKEGVTSVNFPGVPTPVPAVDVFNSNTQLRVTVPSGVTPGVLTVSTDGGTSAGQTVPGLLAITSQASLGTERDPNQPSANEGQLIRVQGQGLVDGTPVTFPTISDAGVAGSTSIEFLRNASPDGTSAEVFVPNFRNVTSGRIRLDGVQTTGGVPLQIVPTISFITDLVPNATANVNGSGFEEGNSLVNFSASGTSVPSTDVLSGNHRLTVTVPSDFTAPIPGTFSTVTVTTGGGTSNSFKFANPILTNISAVAAVGTPADPSLPSANVGQSITMAGAGFHEDSSGTRAGFASFADASGTGTIRFQTPEPNSVDPGGTTFTVVVPDRVFSGGVTVQDFHSGLGGGTVDLQIVPTIAKVLGKLDPGTQVIIQGTGFNPVSTEVLFPGVSTPIAAVPVSIDDGNGLLAVATVPVGSASTGDVVVVTNGGTSNTFTFTQESVLLLGISPDDDRLRLLDPATGNATSSGMITLAGSTVQGGTGMAVHPGTGQVWGLLKLSGQPGRRLVTLDLQTGIATSIGNTGDNFAALAFTSGGVLYGVTGDGATTSETLFILNQTNGTPNLVTTLGAGDRGEALAFNSDDGLLYHASGASFPVFESIDPATLATTTIPLNFVDGTYDEPGALVYQGNGTFLMAGSGKQFLSMTAGGEVRFIANLPFRFKGFVPLP